MGSQSASEAIQISKSANVQRRSPNSHVISTRLQSELGDMPTLAMNYALWNPGFLLLLPLAVTLYFFAQLVFHWRAVDRFLEALYRDHHDIWISLGKPRGWQWSPPGSIATPFSMFSFRWAWLRDDPDWLSRVPQLREQFQRLRYGFRLWNLRAMPIMVERAMRGQS